MANHVRRQIRDAAVTALTGLVTTGARVYASRIYPLQDANLPALRIDTNTETIAPLTMTSDRLVERVLELVVQACVKQNNTYNDTIDLIIKEVEIALSSGANQVMGGAKSVQLKSIEIEMGGEGEKPVAIATMTFDVPYYTELSTPDVAA